MTQSKYFKLVVPLIIVCTLIGSCNENTHHDLEKNKDGQFVENKESEIRWRVVLLSDAGKMVKEWDVKTEPKWLAGDDGMRCSFPSPETGNIMVSRYTYIEPYYVNDSSQTSIDSVVAPVDTTN